MVQVEMAFRENFGFLYNHLYKGAFLVFIAFVNLGLSSSSPELEVATTTVVLVDGFALVVMTGYKPEWFPTEEFDASVLAPPHRPTEEI